MKSFRKRWRRLLKRLGRGDNLPPIAPIEFEPMPPVRYAGPERRAVKANPGQKRYVVYTCLFGFSEEFLDHRYETQNPNIDFLCFTDNERLAPKNWTKVIVSPLAMDATRASKRIKHCFFEHLSDYDASLYVDNTAKLKVDPARFFDFLDDKHDLWMFRHPERDCVYDEAKEVLRLGFDSCEIVNYQMSVYRTMGFPAKAGLFQSTVILRDHHNKKLPPAMLEWHFQLLRYSLRDQLSLPLIIRQFNLRIGAFPGEITDNDLLEWPFLKDPFRLPRDFDDVRYLKIHPKVINSGMMPREHYFLNARKQENWPYK